MSVKKYSNKTDGNVSLNASFKVKEFACKDGSDQILIDTDLINVLQQLRAKLNCSKMIVASGYRTEAYNKKIGGAASSFHTKGQASDIQCYDQSGRQIDPKIVCCKAQDMNIAGIGYMRTATHIDVGNRKWWGDETVKPYKALNDFYKYFGIKN